MGKLNALKIKNAKPITKEVRLSDGNGLVLRIRASGAKSWLYCFRLPNSRTLLQMTLGSLDDISLQEARDILPELRKQVSQGLDPRKVRAAQKNENTQAITMRSLFDAWIEFIKLTNNITPKWIKAHERRWNLHLKNTLGNILAKDITRAHLAAALDSMVRKGIREETRKTLTMLNLMLDYALKRHLVDQNPARVLKPKDFSVSANTPRDRVLSFDELRKLWAVLDQATQEQGENFKISSLNIITATALKLLILTGARRGEIAAMRWDELSLQNGFWEIPSKKTKNRHTHTIFLAPLAINLIETLKPITGQSAFVFDTALNSHGHIHTDTITKSLRRLLKKDKPKHSKKKTASPPLAEMKPFTVHDIRRTAATAWGEYLKIQPHIIERMLNHQPLNKLVRTYQRAMYIDEQKEAWHKWGEVVDHQIAKSQGNVFPIKKAASN